MGRKRIMKGRPEQIDGHDRYVHQWDVPSRTDPSKTYKVSIDDKGNWLCSCPRFKFQKKPIAQKTPCTHILMVMGQIRAQKAWRRRKD